MGPLGPLPNMRWCDKSNRYYAVMDAGLMHNSLDDTYCRDSPTDSDPCEQVRSTPVDTAILHTLPKISRKRERIQSIECSICYRNTSNPKSDPRMRFVNLPCGHTFHLYCIEQWLSKRSGSCPNCRQPVDTSLAAAAGSAHRVQTKQC